MKGEICTFLLVMFCIIYSGCNQNSNPKQGSSCQNESLKSKNREIINQNIPVTKLIDSLNIDVKKIYLLIEKHEYLLSILSDSMLIKQFPVVFGKNPIDDKLREGDYCTPEGTFCIVNKYSHSKWSKFVLIDYPNQESWRKFNNALNNGIIPSDSRIGGEIGIHGVPEGEDIAIDVRDNWTLGCISMKRDDINELYEVVNINTRVLIKK
jgi:murein L,D-transpeptidase YafK